MEGQKMSASRELRDARGKNWWWMENALIDMDHLARMGTGAWAILCVLSRHADNHGECFPSLTYLEKKTGLSRQGVVNAMKVLLAGHYVGKCKSGGPHKGSNVYRIRSVDEAADLSAEGLFEQAPVVNRVDYQRPDPINDQNMMVNHVDQVVNTVDQLVNVVDHRNGVGSQRSGLDVVNVVDSKNTNKKKLIQAASAAADSGGDETVDRKSAVSAARRFWQAEWSRAHDGAEAGWDGQHQNSLGKILDRCGVAAEPGRALRRFQLIAAEYFLCTRDYHRGHPLKRLAQDVDYFFHAAEARAKGRPLSTGPNFQGVRNERRLTTEQRGEFPEPERELPNFALSA